MISNSKFEYFLNAIHYHLWLHEIRFDKFIGRIVYMVLSPIPKYFFTQEFRKKVYDRQLKEKDAIDYFFNNEEYGGNIGWANRSFYYLYSSYSAFFSYLLLAFVFHFLGNTSYFAILLAISVPIGIFFIPAYRAVFANDRYRKYFKRFKNEDKRWHKKWKRRTQAFCIGAIVIEFLGVSAMMGILMLLDKK